MLINSVCHFLFDNERPAVTCYIVSSPCKRLFPALILRRLKAFKIKLKIQLNNAAVSTLNHNNVTFSSLSSIFATQFGNQKRNLEAKNSQIWVGGGNIPDFSFTRTSIVTCHEEFRDFNSVSTCYCHFKQKPSNPQTCPAHDVAGRTNAAWQETALLKTQLNNRNKTFAICFMNASERYHLNVSKDPGT